MAPRYREKVSVVVPTYNRKEKLIRLVHSLLNSEYKNIEIIIVDDSSEYDVKETVHNVFGNKKNINVIRNNCERFVSYSRNIGIKKSRGEYVFLIDDDNIVDRKCISELVATLKTKKDIGAVTPLTFYFEKPDVVWRAGVKLNLISSQGYVPFKDMCITDTLGIPRYIECDTGPNAVMVRKKIARIVKYDYEKFPFDHEDIDFCLRIKKLGYKIVCCTTAKVWHDIPFRTTLCEKMNIENELKAYLSGRNKILFHRRHSNYVQLLVFVAVFLPIITAHRVGSILLNPKLENKSKINILCKYFLGIVDGIFM